MNAKQAKRIRRAAEKATVGRPFRRLIPHKRGYLINDPNTTRGVYRAIKRAVA